MEGSRIVTLLLCSVVFLLQVVQIQPAGLKCYKCGTYITHGTVTPCMKLTENNLAECQSKEKYCVKHVIKGGVTMDCAETCTESTSGPPNTFCCQEDRCNSGTIWHLSPILLAITSLMALRWAF